MYKNLLTSIIYIVFLQIFGFLDSSFVLKTYFSHFGTTVLIFIDCIINIAVEGHFKIIQCNGYESA